MVAGADPVHRVSIVPRGQALGVTYQRPDSDRYNYPEGYLRARIIGMLGGRAAEEIVFGTKTTGAQNDIEQASALARDMVTRWGMSERLGMVQLAPRENPYLAATDGVLGGGDRTARRRPRWSTPRCTASFPKATTKRCACCGASSDCDALAAALLERETVERAGHP